MKIDRILQGIRESQAAEKTASAPSAAIVEKTASANPLVAALHEALQPAEKTASAALERSPVDDVMKVAQELAGAEKEAATKEAQLLGTAFADAAVARLNEWNKTAATMVAGSPVAQAIPGNADFGKFAEQNPELVKQAAQLGYEKATADLEKQAEDSYIQGYNDTVETIHKTASLEFMKAAAVTAQIIDASLSKR